MPCLKNVQSPFSPQDWAHTRLLTRQEVSDICSVFVCVFSESVFFESVFSGSLFSESVFSEGVFSKRVMVFYLLRTAPLKRSHYKAI